MTPEQLQALLEYIRVQTDAAVMRAQGYTPSWGTIERYQEAVWFAFGLEPPA